MTGLVANHIHHVLAVFTGASWWSTICHAGWMLAEADIVRGRRATYVSAKTDLVNAGAQFEVAEVVVDRNLVTSRTPKDLPAFGEKLTEILVGQTAGQREPALAGSR